MKKTKNKVITETSISKVKPPTTEITLLKDEKITYANLDVYSGRIYPD